MSNRLIRETTGKFKEDLVKPVEKVKIRKSKHGRHYKSVKSPKSPTSIKTRTSQCPTLTRGFADEFTPLNDQINIVEVGFSQKVDNS